jgi:hypothetical protein
MEGFKWVDYTLDFDIIEPSFLQPCTVLRESLRFLAQSLRCFLVLGFVADHGAPRRPSEIPALLPKGRLDFREDFICWHELDRPVIDFSSASLDILEPGGVYVSVPWAVQLFPKLAEQGLLRIAKFSDFLLNMR